MPAQAGQMGHQRRISEPTIGEKDHVALLGKKLRGLVQPRVIDVLADTAARMFQHLPDEGDGAPAIDDRQPHKTLGIPQQRRI